MRKYDYHTHTAFCDGKNTPEELVVAAIEKGICELGITVHSYTPFDESYCVKQGEVSRFQEEIQRLKGKYQDKIRLFCGVEQDVYAPLMEGFDYRIGSAHYLKVGENYYPIDSSKEEFVNLAKQQFAGDYLSLVECYFETLAEGLEKVRPNLIGHFDLISKYNEGNQLFDAQHPRYLTAWKQAAKGLAALNIPFEINTGGIARGYKSQPYPSLEMIQEMASLGGKFLLSSDSHKKETLCFEFDQWREILKENEIPLLEGLSL